MLIIGIGLLIALGFFYYFQQKAANRNLERFQKSRDKFEQMLQQLRKSSEQEDTGNEADQNKKKK